MLHTPVRVDGNRIIDFRGFVIATCIDNPTATAIAAFVNAAARL